MSLTIWMMFKLLFLSFSLRYLERSFSEIALTSPNVTKPYHDNYFSIAFEMNNIFEGSWSLELGSAKN
jgi:hypothetical protein